MAETAQPLTMDTIVSLCRRRGFVFPSSEIYGGLGSTYDYGHYGVLTKNNIRSLWFRAMVQERDDIVALDSAIILNPRVWEASGHVAGFTDPLVDCRTCKLRFRADQLELASCGRKPSKRPGETPDCDLTEPRQFNLMFETHVGALQDEQLDRLPPPRDRAGHLHQLQERRPARAPQAAVRHRAGRRSRSGTRSRPGNFLFRLREFEQMEMEFFVPPAEADEWYAYWVDARRNWYLDLGLREENLRVREHDASERSHYSSATSDLEYLYPIGWQELEGVANRGDYDLTQHTQRVGHEARVGRPGRHPLHAVRHRARRLDRPDHAGLPLRRLRRGGRRRPRARRPPPPPARRARQGGDPAAHPERRRDGDARARALRGAAPLPRRRARRQAARSAGVTAARTK